jgi:lysozyme
MDVEALRNLIARHEGLSLVPYRCSEGKLTIGYGRCLDELGITKREASMMLNNDIIRVHGELDKAYVWFRRMSPIRQMAIMSMNFNLGITKFRKFHKMISALALSQWDRAAIECLDSRWAKQVGDRAIEIATMIKTDRPA